MQNIIRIVQAEFELDAILFYPLSTAKNSANGWIHHGLKDVRLLEEKDFKIIADFLRKRNFSFDQNSLAVIATIIPEVKEFQSHLVVPSKVNGKEQGFLCLCKKERADFSEDDLQLFSLLSNLFGKLCHENKITEQFKEHNLELQRIARNMRHGFSNDVQSIALALELLSMTTLSEEQEKYLQVLMKAKKEAIAKIEDMRKLKGTFNKLYE